MSMNLLPQDEHFLEYLKEAHGVELTPEDLAALNEFHFYLRNQSQTRLANDPDAVFYDVQDGKILGIVAFAAIGFFAAPLLGVGGIVGALMGAAIGWRLFGGAKKQEEEKKEEKQAQTYGFDGLSALPAIGGAIPLIYCNRLINPNGGVLSSGFCVNSRVETLKNTQKIYQLFVFGLGQIGAIDTSKTLINDQPLDNFFQGDITITTALGTSNQLPDPDFPIYSQSVSPASNQQIGSDYRGRVVGGSGQTLILEDKDESGTKGDLFTPTERYVNAGVDFKVIAKSGNSITGDKIVYFYNNSLVFCEYFFVHQTTKPVNQIDINISAVEWARKEDKKKGSKQVRKADCFQLVIKPQATGVETILCYFAIASSSSTTLRRVIKIKNLTYGKYTVKINPISYDKSADLGLNYSAYLLDDSGNFTDYNFSGYTVSMEGGIFNYLEPDLNPTNDRIQWGNQGNAPGQVTSINEVVYPSAIGQSRAVGYPSLPMAKLVANASNQLQGSPNVKYLVTVGRNKMRVLVWSGVCTTTHPSALIDVARGVHPNIPGYLIRNLDKGTQSIVATVDGINQILTTQDPISWTKGDRWVSWYVGSSNFFPDIYLDTLISTEGGLGNFIDPDYFIDYDSIVDSKYFCANNSFYWDGVIDKSIAWSQWATRESLGSLLFPSRINGRFALLPEVQRNPVALFNASNIVEGSFTEEFAELQDLNSVVVTYRDGSDARFKPVTVTIMTEDAYNGVIPVVEESLQLDTVTNKNQAIKVGQVYLKTRLLQDRAISFKTGLQGSYLQPGDLIIVQHLITEFDKECSGFALESTLAINGAYVIKFSGEVELGIDPNGYNCACWHLESGIIENNLVVFSDDYGAEGIKLVIYGAAYPILAPSENRPGDYITVGKNLRENRTYKINSVSPSNDGLVELQAVHWVSEMLNANGLVTVS